MAAARRHRGAVLAAHLRRGRRARLPVETDGARRAGELLAELL